MTRFRVSVRAFLTTLAFGLFAASVAGRLSGYFSEVPVDLPKTVSDSPIIVVPESERHPIGHREFFGNLG